MPRRCFLDLFPVEMLHILFNYFSTYEILFTFTDISDYVNSVLFSYSDWKLNFKSIRRDHFDIICDRIQPEKVISLTLSDDNDTPGQSELFFSRFRIEQFHHLQSLTLIKIEFESLKDIFTNLDKLVQLKSLSFEVYSITYKYVYSCEGMRIPLRQLGTIENDLYPRILPRLTRLCLSNALAMKSMVFPQLHHLKLMRCQNDELKGIIQNAPFLQSLDVHLELEHQHMRIDFASSQLIRLRLTISNFQMSMNQMEQFLPNFPHLKYLELILSGTRDLIDGNRWQLLTSSLITFNFKFDIVDSNFLSLDSFQTSFWREEKCWYVDRHKTSVFSASYFSPVCIDIDTKSRQKFPTQFNSMNITSVPKNPKLYYSYINKLSINCSISLEQIQSLVCLEKIKHLSILSITDLLIFQPYELMIPNIFELKIKTAITLDEIKQMKAYQFKQIRKLSISVNVTDIDFILKKLFFCFPHIEYLIYLSPIGSIERLANVIDGFVHLLNATFCLDGLHHMMLMDPYFDLKSISGYSKRLNKNNFTCRRPRIPPFPTNQTHCWIAPQPVQLSSAVQQPSGLQYIWHCLKQYFFWN